MFLRSPEWGNIWRVNTNTLDHRNLGGDLRTYVNQNFPKFQQFSVTFIALTRVEIDSFIDAMISLVGTEFQLEDFEQRTWVGHIIDEQLEVSRGIGECNYSTSFTFEGLIQ